MRALYGHAVRQPAPAEFAVSSTLATHLLGRDIWTGEYGRLGTAVLLVPEAIIGKFRICQTFLSRRPAAPADPALELTTVMVQTVGALFRRMERDAAIWQKTRGGGSEAVPTLGEPDPAETPEPTLDVAAMVESFRLGHRSLQEVWGLVFTPATLVELKKVSQLPADRFRLPDGLWVRIVYDAALSYRLRVIGRDHLLRALTPIYWGWLASFVLEMQQAEPAGLEQRIEALCLAFETSRPYLISRWRWPDRFTP